MEVETDKELGLVFRGWGTGTGQGPGRSTIWVEAGAARGAFTRAPFCRTVWTLDD